MRSLILLAASLGLVAVPAAAEATKTSTSEVEAQFAAPLAEVAERLAAACFDQKLTVERDDFLMSCKDREVDMRPFMNMHVQTVYRFNMIEAAGATRVRGESVNINTKPFGSPTEVKTGGSDDMLALLNGIAAAE